MPRDRVFISYSHQDEAFLQAFRVHLKPWEDRELLETWSDHKINTSQDWHQTIQAALQETAVAVLLISPDFLASDYIRQHELPDLLRAREEGEIDLACLYVRDSGVDDDDAAFEVTLSTGEMLSVKLTKYQGLNNPRDVVAAMPASARDTLYKQAAAEIKALMTRRTPRAARAPTGKRFELTVQLKLSGSHLTRTYVHHYGRIAQATLRLAVVGDSGYGRRSVRHAIRITGAVRQDFASPLRLGSRPPYPLPSAGPHTDRCADPGRLALGRHDLGGQRAA